MLICGIDEAGRGPVIGPMVVAGVAVENEEELKKLTALGVKDSKKHSPGRREKLASEIKKFALSEIVILSNYEIDMEMESKTITEIEVDAFAEVIRKIKPDIVYVDAADVSEERFKNSILSKLGFQVEIISKHKADVIYPIVSAASIIAKVTRDSEIKRIQSEIGEEIGSGYPSDKRTIDFIERWIKTKNTLPPYVRKSWKTISRLGIK